METYRVVPMMKGQQYDPDIGSHGGYQAWTVRDTQETVVCECDSKWNAVLICKLLNKYS